MITPKRRYPRPIQRVPKPAPRYCANPNCGAKLTSSKQKYCDMACYREHVDIMKRARRPQEVHCSFCDKPLDVLSRYPARWKAELNFCDEVCADGYRREHGNYHAASERGSAAIQEYKARHGCVPGNEKRRAITSQNNRLAPPKAKHFERRGRVWGYEVIFYPDENGSGYRASMSELIDELGIIHCKTVKEGLRLIRQRIVEQRQAASNE